MKSVGQAVNEGQSFCWDNNRMAHVLRCIGIAPWGYVRDRMNLIEAENGEVRRFMTAMINLKDLKL
jgi:hypothetical protein